MANFSERTRLVFLLCCLTPENFYPSTENIASYLKVKYNTARYHILKLRKEELIDKHNNVTDKGKKLYTFIVGWDKNHLKNCPKKLRLHNLQISFDVIKTNKQYKDYSTVYQPFTNKRYRGLKTELLGCKVQFYHPKRIVVQLLNIFANTPEELLAAQHITANNLKLALEKEFDVKIGDYVFYKTDLLHVAVINSVIAENLLLEGKTFKSKVVHIDGSHNNSEIEAVDKNTALQLIEHLVDTEDLARTVESLRNELGKAQSLLDKNGIDYKRNNMGIENSEQ